MQTVETITVSPNSTNAPVVRCIRRLKIGRCTMIFVLRHKWEKEEYPLQNFAMWRDYRIGLWYKKSKCVGIKDFKKAQEWSRT